MHTPSTDRDELQNKSTWAKRISDRCNTSTGSETYIVLYGCDRRSWIQRTQTERHELDFIDIRRACFRSNACRQVFVQLRATPCHWDPGTLSHHLAAPPRPPDSTRPKFRRTLRSSSNVLRGTGSGSCSMISLDLHFCPSLRTCRILRCLSVRSWPTRCGGV